MMSDPDMIEIPFVYYSGRRAALRLVAGSTGTEAFGKALREWSVTAEDVSAPQPILPEPAPPASSDETPVAELAKPWKLKLPDYDTGPHTAPSLRRRISRWSGRGETRMLAASMQPGGRSIARLHSRLVPKP